MGRVYVKNTVGLSILVARWSSGVPNTLPTYIQFVGLLLQNTARNVQKLVSRGRDEKLVFYLENR